MTKYIVNLQTIASTAIEVEADDRDAALDAAFELTPGLCAQCSGWGQAAGVDLGEWDIAEEGGKPAEWAIDEVGA